LSGPIARAQSSIAALRHDDDLAQLRHERCSVLTGEAYASATRSGTSTVVGRTFTVTQGRRAQAGTIEL
jgi:hypothetical protein